MLFDELRSELAGIDALDLRRSRRTLETPCGPRLRVDGREVLAFCSNDYLGLAAHPQLHAALSEGIRQWGAGSGASPLVSGHYAAHQALEQRLAEFVGCARAIEFSTGFMANIGTIAALAGRGDAIFADRLNHASLLDGALLSRAELHRYPHLDLDALGRQLSHSGAARKLIVSDTVFSMDGDLAPLPALLQLAETFDALLVVDDAHGLGVLGPGGRGALAHFGLSSPRIVQVGTLGKAAGLSGAFVAGDELVIELLLQKARSYLFSTAASPALAHALSCALDLLGAADAERAHLQALIGRLRAGLSGWQLADSATPIQPLIVGSNEAALALSAALWREGLWVPAIRPPTVPRGTARLRISLSAAHSMDEVDRLVAALQALGPQP